MEAGYYYFYCGIIMRPNEETEYEDYADFDLHLNMVEKELERIEPGRQPYLETAYFTPELIEVSFRFRASYRDREDEIRDYINLVKRTIEEKLYVTIEEFNIEGTS